MTFTCNIVIQVVTDSRKLSDFRAFLAENNAGFQLGSNNIGLRKCSAATQLPRNDVVASTMLNRSSIYSQFSVCFRSFHN